MSKENFNKIRRWDFENSPTSNGILVAPIPMSMLGKMTLDELKIKHEIAPVMSGDQKVIYCFSIDLAIKMLRAGHTLELDNEKFFIIAYR